jgi:hypothetical protein
MAKKIYDIVPPGKAGVKKEKLRSKVDEGIRVKPKSGKKKYIFASLVIIFLAVVVAQLWFSNIKISIKPAVKDINFEMEATTDLSANKIDFGAGVIPAQILQTQKVSSEKFLSTGKEVKQAKAKGVIRIYNGYSEASRTLLKSRFVSANGKLFWSLKTAVVPGATYDSKGKLIPGYVDLNVEAAEVGEDYNIEATTFALPALAGTPLYSSIYGKSFSSMSGGINKEVIKASSQDIDSAKESLTKKVEEENGTFLKSNFSDFIVLDGSLSHEVLEVKSSVEPNAEIDSFEIQANIKTTGIAISKNNLDAFVRNGVDSNADGLFGEEGGIVFSPQIKEAGLEDSFTVKSIDLEKGKAVLDLKVNAVVFANSDMSELKRAVFGKSAKETELFLRGLNSIEMANVKYWPFWVGTAPANDCKIAIDFEK